MGVLTSQRWRPDGWTITEERVIRLILRKKDRMVFSREDFNVVNVKECSVVAVGQQMHVEVALLDFSGAGHFCICGDGDGGRLLANPSIFFP